MSSIKDVARLAGVSISTVSRVLNDSCPVSEEKRERVLQAAGELGYTPNPAARSLLLRKTGVVGVVLPFATGEFFSEFLSGVDKTTSDNDYFLLISVSHRSETDLQKAVRSFDKRVDGLIVWEPEMIARDVRSLVKSNLPIVFLNTAEWDKTSDAIDFDNFGGILQAVSHLIELGHRDIAFVGGPEPAADARDRRRAYRETLRNHGLAVRPDLEFPGDYTVEAGYRTAKKIAAQTTRPTAVVAGNDQSAFGLLRGLQEAGVSVPDEISLTGFDDIPSSRYINPPLTTVRVPVREMGVLAVDTLVRRIAAPHAKARRELLPVELVIRQSTAPPSNGSVRTNGS